MALVESGTSHSVPRTRALYSSFGLWNNPRTPHTGELMNYPPAPSPDQPLSGLPITLRLIDSSFNSEKQAAVQ